MERLCIVLLKLCVSLSLWEFCDCFPIDLESNSADSHLQFLTGLIAVLLAICGVFLLVGCLCCQKRNGFKEFRDSPVVASVSSNLDTGHVNLIANSEFTIFTPLEPPAHLNNVFHANQTSSEIGADKNRHGQADLSVWFDRNRTEFPRDKLKYIKELGKGWFGKVVEGTAQTENGEEPPARIVVRILESSATCAERAIFLHDATMYYISEHPNILKLVGSSVETVPLLLIQDYCRLGDLKQYLCNNTSYSSDWILQCCCQIAGAIKYLHNAKLTHPDIACRSCLVDDTLNLKLGDYGLQANLYPEDYYQGAPGVPIRWCAPESIAYTQTTIEPKPVTYESNIWSLGVTFWEICEHARQPYSHLTDDEVVAQVFGIPHLRLSRPNSSALYIEYVYKIMQLCWSTLESRPSANQIDAMLTDLNQVFQHTFDKRWDNLKPNSVVKSASLNNLHGSLDNLASDDLESWLETVASDTGDMQYVHGLSTVIKELDNALALEQTSSSDSSPKVLGSDTETEDETWRRQIERGALSEKIKQKSKSVADLMVLTHIDCSESDSETPMHSLEWKKKGVFGSEGNISQVSRNLFQEELLKLQEERRDSLLFVPAVDTYRVLNELTATNIEPMNQVFNVFNVTIESPSMKLLQVPKLSEIIENNIELVDYIIAKHETVFKDMKTYEELEENGVNNNIDIKKLNSCKLSCDFQCTPENKYFDFGDVSMTANFLHVEKVHYDCDKNDESSIIIGPCVEYSMDFYKGLTTTYTDSKDYPEFIDYSTFSADNNDVQDVMKIPQLKYTSLNSENNQNEAIIQSSLVSSKENNCFAPEEENTEDLKYNNVANCLEPSIQGDENGIENIYDKDSTIFESNTESTCLDLSSPEVEELTVIDIEANNELSDSNKGTLILEALPNEFENANDELKIETTLQNGAAESSNVCNDVEKLKRFDSSLKNEDAEEKDWEVSSECMESPVRMDENINESSESDENISSITDEVGDDLEELNTTFTISNKEENEDASSQNIDYEDVLNKTFTIVTDNETTDGVAQGSNETVTKNEENENWSKGGWFLHPQTEPLEGHMETMDEEAMAAIRNELLSKLPQAIQGTSDGNMEEDDEWDTRERDQVLIRYHIPLSPIPEEYTVSDQVVSYSEMREHYNSDNSDSDWSLKDSNDTLFNLEALEAMEPQEVESPVKAPPLPSPEDIPWRQLPASLLSYNQVVTDEEGDLYGNLTDIRFLGPCCEMSTSFSESAEQDWESGSDTRSSSSGEFIWKEGEHEESLRALDATSNEGEKNFSLAEENPNDEDSDGSEEDEEEEEEEEGESHEFIPSAWDMNATPTKSSFRSPNKVKPTRGVWFKKQKYHCVYEYPREPETPLALDLWKPITDLTDWKFDEANAQNSLYQLAEFPLQYSGIMNGKVDDDFYISSTARPFEEDLSSQFFPGQLWTPDSGVGDVTPDMDYVFVRSKTVQTLKSLAAAAASKLTQSNSLGGLRHTRDKLKLDLPGQKNNAFALNQDFVLNRLSAGSPVLNREAPTFTTFGKSRFQVSHVWTPPEEQIPGGGKDVSFEALPYKGPLLEGKCHVRGEASLLDSTDEDSGIESSTLERQKLNQLL